MIFFALNIAKENISICTIWMIVIEWIEWLKFNWRQIILLLQTAGGEESIIQGVEVFVKNFFEIKEDIFSERDLIWSVVSFGLENVFQVVLKVWHDLLIGGEARYPAWGGGDISDLGSPWKT